MSTTFERHPAVLLVPADEVHAGDVVRYCGEWHEVIRVDRGDGWLWPVATDGAGWAMALGHDLIALHHAAR